MPLPARMQDGDMTPVRHVVYLHGFASSPASSKAERVARELAAHGVGFSCPDFNRPEFETLTTTRMLEQVDEALSAIPEGPVALMGSSLGGFVAIHAVARASAGTVDRLVLLAPAVDFGGNRLRQLGDQGIDDWRRLGSLDVFHYAHNARRKVGFALYEDSARYDAYAALLRVPALVFQGRRDASVMPETVERWAATRPLVDLRLLDDEHQLTASMDLIWRETAAFLGLA
jgi:pimeloyl-ACP methyl ester carboxylesterase